MTEQQYGFDPRDSKEAPAGSVAGATGAAARRKPDAVPTWIWFALGLLFLLALAVIFVLPQLVNEYELPFTRRAAPVDAVVAVQPAAQPSTAISPFDEAQRARQRTEAQEVLARVLELQADLDASQASVWAQQPYQSALDLARAGDEGYRSQQFDVATENYRQAEEIFSDLLQSVPDVFQQYLLSGSQALRDGDAAAAQSSFSLALQLQPGSAEASRGLERARTLDEVLGLLDSGRSLREENRLSEASTVFEQAIALDADHEEARSELAATREAIAEQEFTAVMSSGFASLQAGRAEEAINSFERALRMRPGSQQAQAALSQTRDELAVNRISRHRDRAEGFAAAEQWQQAVAEYEAALEVDANLVFANEGRDYAAKRLQLDRLLQDAIERPMRLADPAVYEQTVGVYYTGRNLPEAGPRLGQQLDRLEQLLQEARIPVDVQLVSDSATSVTVYQVGELGQFDSRVLSLLPGSYVAVGTRPGFRDVRAEFEVGFGKQSQQIRIQCNEPVVANRQR